MILRLAVLGTIPAYDGQTDTRWHHIPR